VALLGVHYNIFNMFVIGPSGVGEEYDDPSVSDNFNLIGQLVVIVLKAS